MRSIPWVFLGLVLLSCNDSPTDPAPPDQRMVIDRLGVVVTNERVDFNFYYYFVGASGRWTAFNMQVDSTTAGVSAVPAGPYPEFEVQLFASFFPLTQHLTTGDSVWFRYRFTGQFFQDSVSTGTFEFNDSVRTAVR